LKQTEMITYMRGSPPSQYLALYAKVFFSTFKRGIYGSFNRDSPSKICWAVIDSATSKACLGLTIKTSSCELHILAWFSCGKLFHFCW
jgi:hypothetical protein